VELLARFAHVEDGLTAREAPQLATERQSLGFGWAQVAEEGQYSQVARQVEGANVHDGSRRLDVAL
jgi:hypothetical protein